jgi:hypothetical protein
MHFNFDAHYAKHRKPWEFTFERDGQAFSTRELTEKDVQRLQSLQQASSDEQLQFTAGLFLEPKPDLSAWPGDALVTFIAAIIGYYVARRRELAEGIHREVQRIMQGADAR